ncbi:MAG: class C sortase [Oscillospiraceae bacterium]|nr:class C sortase [Oscillospiraceae bacterium]
MSEKAVHEISRSKKKQTGKKRSKKIKWLFRIVIYVLVIGGIAILLYPVLGKMLSAWAQTEVIEDYHLSVAQMNEEAIRKEWENALAYNQELEAVSKDGKPAVLEDYQDVLNKNNIIGYLEISSLDIRLPIYHSVANDVLDKGIGHIPNTALPIGREGDHTVLSAHSGHPTASLFDKLHLLKMGDTFDLFVLDKKFTYQVNNIATVLPDNTSLLQPEPGYSYVTLMTCTPYGINSHRLLIRGDKITEEKLMKTENEKIKNDGEVKNIASDILDILIVFTLIMSLLLYSRYRDIITTTIKNAGKGIPKKREESQ